MKKTKLLLIVEALGGGVRTHIIDLIINIDRSKYDIYMLYSLGRDDNVLNNSIGLLKKYATLIESKYMQRSISLKQDYKAYTECKRIINEIKPDIVHCHSAKAGVYGRVAAKRLKVDKVFYTPHAYYFQNNKCSKFMKKIYVLIERILSKRYTMKTINVSYGEKRCALENKLDEPEKFSVIYNGIADVELPDKKVIREELSLGQDDYIIGVTARLIEQKDPMTFAKIAKRIIRNHENVHFVYVGDGPLHAEVEEYIKSNQIENNFHLLGFKENANVLVVAFDLYLITSLYEGLPYSPIEALRAGVPIIATRTTGNDEIVIDGENGYLFEIGNVKQGVELIESIIASPLSKSNIRASFEKKFMVTKMIKSIELEYFNII